jgi:hypothetical protein
MDEYLQLVREEYPYLQLEDELPFDPDTEFAFLE